MIGHPEIRPAFGERNIPVALATDENYLPYLKVLVNSIVANAKSGNVDVIVLCGEIGRDALAAAERDFPSSDRLSVRFVDVSDAVEKSGLADFAPARHLTRGTLYRLLLPDLLVNYKKVVYLDVDVVVLGGIGELYGIDIGDDFIGAVTDWGAPMSLPLNPGYEEWAMGYGFTEWLDYVNAGILLMNLDAFRRDVPAARLISLACSSKWQFDQDALNILCKGRIRRIDPRWNIQVTKNGYRRQAGLLSAGEPFAIHYAGRQKPWNNPETLHSSRWWEYAVNDGVALWRKAFGTGAQTRTIGHGVAASVVVAIYNARKYLHQMLLSLEAQTLRNIEIICVDDGSTDGSLEICNEFAGRDERFKVVSQPNTGAASARNHGLDVAHGEWVMFVDADDFCRPEMLESMVSAGVAGANDVVVAGRYIIDCRRPAAVHEWKIPREYLEAPPPVTCSTPRIDVFSGPGYTAWNKLFRRDFLLRAGLRFRNTPPADDVFVSISSLIKARSIGFVGGSFYYYRNGLSASQLGQADRHPDNFLKSLQDVKAVVLGCDSSVRAKFFRSAVQCCFNNLFERKTSDGVLKTYAAIRDGGLESLGFDDIEADVVDLGWARAAYDLVMAGADMHEVLCACHYARMAEFQRPRGRGSDTGRPVDGLNATLDSARSRLRKSEKGIQRATRAIELALEPAMDAALDRPVQERPCSVESTGNAFFDSDYVVVPQVFRRMAFSRADPGEGGRVDAAFAWGSGRIPANMAATGLAMKHNAPLFLCEDGWLRSADTWCNFGAPPKYRFGCSLIFDTRAFYYDATRQSTVERMLNDPTLAVSDAQKSEARRLIGRIVSNRLTKYNHQPVFALEAGRPGRRKILVVDQSYGDYAIKLGWADDSTFESMLKAAMDENPDADILVKTHPDTMTGARKGYYDNLVEHDNVFRVTMSVNPYSLLDVVDKVYVCTTQLGFEALMAGKEVHVFGMPFYAGWGLTVDAQRNPRRTNRRSLEEVFYIFYVLYTHWTNPETGRPCTIDESIDYLLALREEYRVYATECKVRENPDEAGKTAAQREACARPEKQIASLKRRLSRCQREISELHKSQAYRVGMAVTWPARKAWGGIKCLRENGLTYTAKHIIGKVARTVGFHNAKW